MTVSLRKLAPYTLSLAAVGAFIATTIPEADAARRASLAENRLILDKNDVYLFPQLATEYTNLLSFEYGMDTDSGSGLMLLGDRQRAFGIGIFQGDLLDSNLFPYSFAHDNLGSVDGPVGLFNDYPEPHTIVDLFGSINVGVDGLLGARLSLGNGGQRMINAADEVSSNSQTFIAATLGYSALSDAQLDIGTHIQFSSGSTVADDTDQASASTLRLGATVRGLTPFAANMDLGYLVDAYFSTLRDTAIADPDIDGAEDFVQSANSINLLAGVGPSYDINGVTTIAGYATIGYNRMASDPDADEEDDRTFNTAYILPGVHVAADIQLREWLYFRSGMQYSFALSSTAQEIDTGDRDTIVSSQRGSGFGWRAGLGLEIENFTLDGALQSGFITNGPDFLGGQGGGLFTMVSAGYHF